MVAVLRTLLRILRAPSGLFGRGNAWVAPSNAVTRAIYGPPPHLQARRDREEARLAGDVELAPPVDRAPAERKDDRTDAAA